MKYLTYTNRGCFEMCKNMIASLNRIGVAKERIFVECFDKSLIEDLSKISTVRNTFTLSESLQDYKNWTFDPSSDFAQIVSWKWKLLRKFWLEHKEFIFTDTDIVFFKNPEEKLKTLGRDFCIQADYPGSKYCTGFMYFTDSGTCDEITRYCSINHMDDQIVLNKILSERSDLEERVGILDQSLFPNGFVFYKSALNKEVPYMVHNNHMVGIETKIEKFKEFGNWLI